MLGLFFYLMMILLPILIPLGVTITHALGERRNGRQARPIMFRRISAVAR